MSALESLPNAQEAQNRSAQIFAQKQQQDNQRKLAQTLLMNEEIDNFEKKIIEEIEKWIEYQSRRLEIDLPKNLRIVFTGYYNLDEQRKKKLWGHINNYNRSFINQSYPEISDRLEKIQNLLESKWYKVDWKNDSESEHIYLEIFIW